MTARDIKQRALQLGYTACGIIPAEPFEEFDRYLEERVRTYPQSSALYQPLSALASIPAEARSIVVCTRAYNKYRIPSSLNGRFGKVYLFDGRVSFSAEERMRAALEEYIRECGIGLVNAAVPARWAAAKAGIGKFARNNFIYDRENGSYLWIDTWVLDRELAYEPPVDDVLAADCREGCKRCVKACPTNALSDSLSMDRGKCVAHLSFYAREVTGGPGLMQMGAWQYGCDACQDACPLNRGKWRETEEFPQLAQIEEYLQPERLLNMDQETYIRIVYPRFWYSGKDGLWLWRCNALRGMIHSGDPAYHPAIRRACGDEDTRIAGLAAWGCETLGI